MPSKPVYRSTALLVMAGSLLAGLPGLVHADDAAAADVMAGKRLVTRYGCAACHAIPGIGDVRGEVGPPLAHIARRAYIGGVLPNSADNMARWLRNPPAVDPLTAMPALGMTEDEARQMTAYLYTLK